MYKNLSDKIKKKKFTISVVGLGYIGLPLALSFAQKILKLLELIKIVIRLKNKKLFKLYKHC